MIISTSNDLERIVSDHIVYVSSDGNYLTLVQADVEMRIPPFQLRQIEEIIAS